MVNSDMIEELILVKFLMERDKFLKYYKYISKLSLEKETKDLLKSIKGYFKEYPEANSLTSEDLILFNSLKNPLSKKNSLLEEYFKQLHEVKLNNFLVEENFNAVLERYYAGEILYMLSEALEETTVGKLKEVEAKLKEFEENRLKLARDNSSKFVTHELEELLETEMKKPGLAWGLNGILRDLGELRGGTLGHVFARVDTGKTTFVISTAAWFAKQLKDEERILWCCNEENGTRVMLRLYQAVLGATKQEIDNFESSAKEAFASRGGLKIDMYDNASISIDDIESMLDEGHYRFLIIDQGDKIKFHGDKDMSIVDRLKVLYGKFRELGKKYGCDILTVGQASSDAEGQKWLRTTHMDYSKTGKPGELDYAIGIGKSHADFGTPNENVRYISLCKNKLGTGAHGRYEVFIDTDRAMYVDTPIAGGQAANATASPRGILPHLRGLIHNITSPAQVQERA